MRQLWRSPWACFHRGTPDSEEHTPLCQLPVYTLLPQGPGVAGNIAWLEQRRNFHLRGHASDFQVAFVDQQIDLAAHAKLWQVDPWLD